MASHASHMLEAALEQMDDIIAGKMGKGLFSALEKLDGRGCQSSDCTQQPPLPPLVDPAAEAFRLTETLRAVLESQGSVDDQGALRNHVIPETANVILKWLGINEQDNLSSNSNGDSYQDRLSRLEGDKESLILQVSVLTDQVEAQGVKIHDLESSLMEHQHKLNCTEEMLQQELLHRTSLEKQKLSLMGEVSYLKLKLTDMEGKQGHGVERQHKAEVLLKELRVLKDKVQNLEDQKQQYEKRLKETKTEISSLQQLLLSKNAEIENLQTQLLARPSLTSESTERDQELQKLRSGMKLLVVANEEKDRRIEELTLLLNQCRQFREVTHTSRQSSSVVRSLSNGWTPSSSSEEEEQGLLKNADSSSAKSDDVKSEVSTNSSSSQQISLLSVQKENDSRPEPQTLSSSMSDITNGHLPKNDLDDSRSQTLPTNSSLLEQNGMGDSSADIQSQKSPDGSENGDCIQRKLEKADDSTSSDNSPVHCEELAQPGQRAVGSPEYMKNNRSFKKLWGKLRRTQSGGFQAADPDVGQFRRGGLRATAGPRLTRTPESDSTRDMNIPFSQWTKEQVCGWLEDYGLGQYVNLARQWIENGQTFLSATPQDFEKEMGMKHPLHRKKLQLALRAFTTKVIEKSSELDHIWVTRWLDDIGLPQYKDQFHEARVDGRMIQYLTVNDLLTLKVTSQLHHLSIKCAIHVLHANKFNPNCLRRRPGDEKQPSPSEVVQWSNHRVMEWLRAVDLAEFAPNLRGSGVHGGLVILEPRFSSETLALLLNIPPQKTLLRRHLATAFAALVGPLAMQEKREYGNATGHVPLTTTAKVKPKKLGFTQFSHLRKRKPDEAADYICPVDSGAVNGVSRLLSPTHRGLSPTMDRHAEK
ncbi:liprin-beta-2 isoform X5 [Kryptolebias marmoratus]|uniref:liprin-beta-2 isoform X5 n=1 Tax=Kryptolebias marmoratus TaxID=37003 RepID=UPI0018ACEBD2|nr:liprin-beta-2 isoform X5 [Kryptolebias marmoratus]